MHIVQTLKFYLSQFYSLHLNLTDTANNSRLHKQKIVISEHRCSLISNLIMNLCQRNFDTLISDLEMMPKLFNKEEDRELLLDVYPIIKLMAQFNSEKAQYDHSFRNLLSHKMTQASNHLSKYGIGSEPEIPYLDLPKSLGGDTSLTGWNSRKNSKSTHSIFNKSLPLNKRATDQRKKSMANMPRLKTKP